MTLFCAVCWYIREDAEEAITIIDGHALCEDHVGLFSSHTLSYAIIEHKAGRLE